MKKRKLTKEQLLKLISEGVNETLKENSDSNELLNILNENYDSNEEKKYISNFSIWLKENTSNFNVQIKEMQLPKNVAGFTTEFGVFLNRSHFGYTTLHETVFGIIHEFEHYKEYLTIPDEMKEIKEEKDFEKFFNTVVVVEKRVDNEIGRAHV